MDEEHDEVMDLGVLHDAIAQHLATRLPHCMVEFYPDLAGRVALPLIALELSEFEDSRSPGDGTVGLKARFQGRIVMDPSHPTLKAAEVAVRMLAVRLAAEINFQSWGMPVGAAQIISVGPDGFRAELDGYLVWMVEWTHELCAGSVEAFPMPAIHQGELYMSVGVGDGEPMDYARPAELEMLS